MKINCLHIQNYRNYLDYSLTFSETTNILIGKNAIGKTNLIEAIYYLSLNKSFKTKINSQLIHFDTTHARIKGEMEIANRNRTIQIAFDHENKKYKVDGILKNKLSEHIGVCNIVLFIPDDLDFVKGSPKVRRNFLDTELSKISPIYVYLINKFNKILKEKNIHLKSNKIDMIYLDVLDEQLSKLEVDIINKRIQFLEDLNNKVNIIHNKFVKEKEIIQLYYKSFTTEKISINHIYQLHKEQRSKEIQYRQSLIGIHRDDIQIDINSKNATFYCSQGQQRTIVLSIKIGLIEVIFDEIGEYPILLLDDVLSELDDDRKSMLLDLISNKIQTFITTTSIDGIEHQLLKNSNKIYINKNESEVS